MALNAKKIAGSGPAREPLEPGNYPARVVGIVDLGVQAQKPYQGKDKPPAQMIAVTYEMLDAFLKDDDGEDIADKPRWLSEQFVLHNLRADKAKSTARYKALDPAGVHDGDWSQLVGTPCYVTVVHNEGKDGRVYDNVGALTPMRTTEARRAPQLINPPFVFDLDNPDMEVWAKLPEWLQEKVKANLHYNGSPLQRALSGAPAKAAAKVAVDEDEEQPY